MPDLQDPQPALMRQAIALATANVTSGRGGPFGALIARGSEIVATGVNLVTATNDPHCPRGDHRNPTRRRRARQLHPRGMPAVHLVRAVSDVHGGLILVQA